MNDLTTNQVILVLGVAVVVGIVVAWVYYLAIVRTPEAFRASVARDALPLITVGVVVAAISVLCFFGMLKENGVVAIIGAVVGYVLGRESKGRKSDS